MDVGINERGRNQSTGSINFAIGAMGGEVTGNASKVPILYGDIYKALTTVKSRVTHEKIVMHKKFLFYHVIIGVSSWQYSSDIINTRQE
jgi:hypothetical protein